MNCNLHPNLWYHTLSVEQIVPGYEAVVLPVFSCSGIEPGKQDTRKTKFHLFWNELDLHNDSKYIEWRTKIHMFF
jgi:hypothetical protein